MAHADQQIEEFAPGHTAIGAAFIALSGEFPDEPGVQLSDIEPVSLMLVSIDLMFAHLLDEKVPGWSEMNLQELVDAGNKAGLNKYRKSMLARKPSAT